MTENKVVTKRGNDPVDPRGEAVSVSKKLFGMKKVLVPTDFSDASTLSAREAISLSALFDARVSMVHVEPCAWPADLEAAPLLIKRNDYRKAAGEWLAEFELGNIPQETRGELSVDFGTPSKVITDYADREKVDLVVLGSHGYTGLKRVFLGSTAESVVRGAHCSVLVVRPKGEPKDVGNPYRRLLVATDFSEGGGKTLEVAAAWAAKLKAELTLLHVVELPLYPRYGYAAIPREDARLKSQAMDELMKVKESLGADKVHSALLRTGQPYQEIVQQAEEGDFDLVIVGNHGHSALARALVGSNAERVVRHAPCSVLVVRDG